MSGEAATGLPVHSSTCIIIMTEVHHLDKCLKEVSLTIHNHDKDSRFESILTPREGLDGHVEASIAPVQQATQEERATTWWNGVSA